MTATAGCATQDYPFVDVSEANARSMQGTRLDAGDKVRVAVFDEPSLTGDYEVGSSGSVTLPLISDVPAAGSTPQQMADAITAKLAQGGYVLNPRVAVDVISYRPFYVIGEVGKPGEYTFTGEMSLLQGIAKAGGFTTRANKGTVVVRRKSWGGGRKVPVGDPGLIIMPGDTITVNESML
ncbi:polysaccharide biosynthesis/export family protein [Novosphingobium sp. AP12]|uniref:polysaccharide biosynthesis/export family protein n=1 Tax=Novosphingobium sp. AP12 TaxID=1144305 RepID=UPI001EE63F62|nr:polysaccharide biosynthesis/export family protein [Novosphingobium sp. AP12]